MAAGKTNLRGRAFYSVITSACTFALVETAAGWGYDANGNIHQGNWSYDVANRVDAADGQPCIYGPANQRQPERPVYQQERIVPQMISVLAVFQIASAIATPGQIDRICADKCKILAIQDGKVVFLNQWLPSSKLTLGSYAPDARRVVPPVEAPVLDVRTRHRWRIVASIYLDHDQDNVLMKLRFYDPRGRLRGTEETLSMIQGTKAGDLFGTGDEIFAITTSEEHAYNDQTEIWLLPDQGSPHLVLEVSGVFKAFADKVNQQHGIAIGRQTYDGVHAETKGTIAEFYVWDQKSKSLKLRKN